MICAVLLKHEVVSPVSRSPSRPSRQPSLDAVVSYLIGLEGPVQARRGSSVKRWRREEQFKGSPSEEVVTRAHANQNHHRNKVKNGRRQQEPRSDTNGTHIKAASDVTLMKSWPSDRSFANPMVSSQPHEPRAS